jgi:three-Cys-motif partner protein
MTLEQIDFGFPGHDRSRPISPKIIRLQQPVWSKDKAALIERYLFLFVMVTKHGTYIDGFAGPQRKGNYPLWTARRVLESEPKFLRHVHLCDLDPRQAASLRQLRADHCTNPPRDVKVYEGDFNSLVGDVLDSVPEKEATFCLLDQRTFECDWATVDTIARHKKQGLKIEQFYFLPVGWLSRAVVALKKNPEERLLRWWGRPDAATFAALKHFDQAVLMCSRFREEFGYAYVQAWPIYSEAGGGRLMYYMIHSTDHPEAPVLMSRAYRQATGRGNPPTQESLPFELPSREPKEELGQPRLHAQRA